MLTSSEIYLLHRGRMMAFARARGLHEPDAEDAVHDVFATLVRVDRLDELRPLPEPDQAALLNRRLKCALLNRRLKCALLNRWRNSQRRCRESRNTFSLAELEEQDWHPSTRVTPATEHDRAWSVRTISGALHQLRRECRGQWQVLTTHLTQNENPAATPGKTRVTLLRARRRLSDLVPLDDVRPALLAA